MSNIIHPSFHCGTSFRIGDFCLIEKGVVIGHDVEILNYVWIIEGTVIGDGVFIDSFCKTAKGAVIEPGVKMRPYAELSVGTVLEKNVFVGPSVTFLGQKPDGSRGEPRICEGAYIGAKSVIHPGVIVGKGSVIGACSNVNKNIPAGVLAFGNPVRVIKEI